MMRQALLKRPSEAAAAAAAVAADAPGMGRYWLCRVVLLHALGLLYVTAFAVAWQQNAGLVGSKGLLPAREFMARMRHSSVPADATVWERVSVLPTMFWFVEPSTAALDGVALAGLCLAMLVAVRGAANSVLLFTLWALYHSIVAVGQTWYSFGWESQLLECGFWAIFLVPLFSLRRFPSLTPTPWIVLFAYRWLLFRLMLGAGLIKIRGDSCWRDLTCMQYHYETQPVPGPLSAFFHHSPDAVHWLEVAVNHVVELVLPWFFLFLSRPYRIWGGIIQIAFQVLLILSGNLSFLNWLTCLPALACFDDTSLAWLFPAAACSEAHAAEVQFRRFSSTGEQHAGCGNGSGGKRQARHSLCQRITLRLRQLLHVGLAYLLFSRSVPVVSNLLSSHQAMNTSFDAFRLVNTYGAFGSVTKERHEVILQGTTAPTLDSLTETEWHDFEFKCKPGDVDRRPCWITPYHYRLDWLAFFAAFQTYQMNPWLVQLAVKILQHHDARFDPSETEAVLALLAHDPFVDSTEEESTAHATNVTYVRAQLYHYQLVAPQYWDWGSQPTDDASATVGKHWRRSFTREYMPPISLDNPSVANFLQQNGISYTPPSPPPPPLPPRSPSSE